MTTTINASTSAGLVQSADTSGILALQTANTTALTIDGSQNVGIGTTTPNSYGAGYEVLQVAGSTGGIVQATGNSNTIIMELHGNTGSGNGEVGTRTNTPVVIKQNNTERMRITSTGTVGIGTTSPTVASGFGVISLGGSTGGLASFQVAGTDTGYVFANATEFAFKGTTAGPATFYTNNTERMRIDSSGNLCIGTTSSSDTSGIGLKAVVSATIPEFAVVGNSTSDGAGGYTLYSTASGALKFYVSYAGTIHATSTTITAISDQRLKENIRDLDVGLNQILAIKPRRFDWIAGKGLDKKDDVGFIAQEFETVFPNSVTNSLAGEDGVEYKAVSQSELIPTLVKAIQEQQALITQLQADVAALKGAK